MLLTILIVFFSLIGLMVLHELGHFLMAKQFKAKVEEFGIGYPPRIFSKKIGETVYSLNLLPFGAFVKIPGMETTEDSKASNQEKLWKRILVTLGGVISFWVIAIVILATLLVIGVPEAFDDKAEVVNSQIQLLTINVNSPAEKAGLKAGDIILNQKSLPDRQAGLPAQAGKNQNISKVTEVQEFISAHKGEEITLTIKRGKEIFEKKVIPRASYSKEEGPLGIVLARVAFVKYPIWQAIPKATISCFNLTKTIVLYLIQFLFGPLVGKPLPFKAELMGPIGIGALMVQFYQLGLSYFLQILVVISLHLAIFNLLPIPVLDGGRLLFLTIEGIRKKPVSQKIERNMIAISFVFILILSIFIAIKDVIKLF